MCVPRTEEDVVVRELLTPAEMKAAEDIQATVWNRMETVPAHMLLAQSKNGGVVLGAFVRHSSGSGGVVLRNGPTGPEEVMIGMSHSFPGRDTGARDSGRVWLYSHMTGILEPYRNRGLGFRMKLFQRKAAMEKGYEEVRWTFDPLYYPNAKLNLAKLGGIVRTYLVDYYGELSDSFSSGIPSDRFLLQWHIASNRVRALLDGGPGDSGESLSGEPGRATPTDLDAITVSAADKWPSPGDVRRGMCGPLVMVPVPADIAGMRHEDLGLVLKWRMATREVFLHYLAAGYVVSGTVGPGFTDTAGKPDGCFRYVLTKPAGGQA